MLLSQTYLMISLIHQEVVLTPDTSMLGMLPSETNVQHALQVFILTFYFLNIKSSFCIFCPPIQNTFQR
jgi:hypothetical protein